MGASGRPDVPTLRAQIRIACAVSQLRTRDAGEIAHATSDIRAFAAGRDPANRNWEPVLRERRRRALQPRIVVCGSGARGRNGAEVRAVAVEALLLAAMRDEQTLTSASPTKTSLT